MEEMTLREICDRAEVTRRAVQGYEKAGLVCATGKNEHGYLLYDTYSLKRIKTIKLYQRCGFTIREITDIIDAPNPVLKVVLENQMVKLQEEERQLELLICRMRELINNLS